MDSGLAALVGAAIGGVASLLGGFFGPWLRAASEKKAQVAEQRAAQRGDGVVAFVDAIFRLNMDPEDRAAVHAVMVAQTRLTVEAGDDEDQIPWACQRAMAACIDGALAHIRSEILTGTQVVLAGWARGLIPPDVVLESIEHHLRLACEALNLDAEPIVVRWSGQGYDT